MKKTSQFTKKDQKTLLIVLVVVVLLIGVYKYVILPNRDKKEDENKDVEYVASASAKLPTSKTLKQVGNNTELKKGSRNLEVKWLQHYYNEKLKPNTTLATDGVFGDKTKLVVKTITGYETTNWTTFKNSIDNKTNGSFAINTGIPSWESSYKAQQGL
jgi:hypothetical protein